MPSVVIRSNSSAPSFVHSLLSQLITTPKKKGIDLTRVDTARTETTAGLLTLAVMYREAEWLPKIVAAHAQPPVVARVAGWPS
jgi:hypothetical protein